MRAALASKKPSYPKSWQDIPLGEEIKAQIEQQLAEVSRQFFGYHLVRLGNLSSTLAMPECPIKHTVNICPHSNSQASVVALNHELPLCENSVDAFVLAHELDFSQDPHQLLREVDRAIIPNGHLVVVGFNPFSLPGLLRYLPIKRENILHEARFFGAPRVKDWLGLLGYEIQTQRALVYSDLFISSSLHPQSRFYQWSAKHLSLLSALYIIVAKKRVVPLTAVKPAWKTKRSFAPVGASMRAPSAKLRKDQS